jgi:beta-glucosidase
VFLSGRPLWVNPQLDASTAFVAAWLPGSEGEGVADVLFRKPSGQIRYDFHGTLPFAWPRTPLQFGLDVPGKPLFPLGYGLRDASDGNLPHLSVRSAVALAPAVSARRFFSAGHSGAGWHWAVLHGHTQERIPHGVGRAAAGAVTLGALDWRRQEDARRLSWTGAAAAAVVLTGATPVNLTRQANGQMVLAMHYRLEQSPAASVTLSMACGVHCAGAVPLTNLLRRAPVGRWQQLRIPLACFARAGANMSRIDTPFAIRSTGRLTLAVADIRVQSDTSGALACPR